MVERGPHPATQRPAHDALSSARLALQVLNTALLLFACTLAVLVLGVHLLVLGSAALVLAAGLNRIWRPRDPAEPFR